MRTTFFAPAWAAEVAAEKPALPPPTTSTSQLEGGEGIVFGKAQQFDFLCQYHLEMYSENSLCHDAFEVQSLPMSVYFSEQGHLGSFLFGH